MGFLGAGLIVILIAAMDYEVLMRYAFGAPTYWAYEVGYMLMGTSFLFTIAFAIITRSHVRVDFLYGKYSIKGRATVDFIGYAFFLLPMIAWTAYGLWNFMAQAYGVGETSGQSAWNPVIWPFRVSFGIGFSLFALQIVAEIFKCLLILTGHEDRVTRDKYSETEG
ncbi:MAG: TRAP transporter small permease subunit [Rhodospirillales bacterium]|nr:TRAP transporter small permease subunit [Rhodospirillales bacterium]